MKKIKSFIVLSLLFALLTGSVAHAHPTSFTWLQSTGDYYIYATMPGIINGDPHANNNIRFYANVYSPREATFEVTLEKKFLLWWLKAGDGYTYTFTQNHHGWRIAASWWSPEAGEYRIKLHNPSIPQATTFTNVSFYRYYTY